MSKKKNKKLEMLTAEYQSLSEGIRRAREELGYIEHNKMRVKRDIKQMMDRQEEIERKREKITGEVTHRTPY